MDRISLLEKFERGVRAGFVGVGIKDIIPLLKTTRLAVNLVATTDSTDDVDRVPIYHVNRAAFEELQQAVVELTTKCIPTK